MELQERRSAIQLAFIERESVAGIVGAFFVVGSQPSYGRRDVHAHVAAGHSFQ
jgi:hypothetical protein